ncbi:unnamed protein product [Vicia faba]|uniref:Uncharacterized protein n=1 Tax=Vicia faba TaxID=3906 RepID=A0AAV1AZZ5_VICFA|nr:unnamed protein product [Vicia faba]
MGRIISEIRVKRKLVESLVLSKELAIEIGKPLDGRNLKNMALISEVVVIPDALDMNSISSRILDLADFPDFNSFIESSKTITYERTSSGVARVMVNQDGLQILLLKLFSKDIAAQGPSESSKVTKKSKFSRTLEPVKETEVEASAPEAFEIVSKAMELDPSSHNTVTSKSTFETSLLHFALFNSSTSSPSQTSTPPPPYVSTVGTKTSLIQENPKFSVVIHFDPQPSLPNPKTF